MKIYLIRHGETTGDIENRYGGAYDDHLSENGKKQVEELAKKLSEKGIETIYHSSLIRTKETAAIVGQKLNIKTEEIGNMRERNQYGVLSGLTKKEAKEKFTGEVEKLKVHPYKNYVTDSETYEDFVPRIINAFEEIIKISEEKKLNVIAIVTHGGPIKAMFREYFQIGELKRLGDCAIIEIEKESHGFHIIAMDGAEIKWKK